MKPTYAWARPVRAATLLTIVAGGAVLASLAAMRADRELRQSLLRQAVMLAQTVETDCISALSGTAADLHSNDYQRLKAQFIAVRAADPKCRFLYITRRRADGTVLFLVDSEPPDSEDYSPPGQIYEEVPATFLQVFETNTANVEGPVADRWGTWVSPLVPISDPQTGTVLAVVGMDVDATVWKWNLARAALPAVLLCLILAGIFCAGRWLAGRRSQMAGMPPGWMRWIDPSTAAAMGLALTLFTAWSMHQHDLHARDVSFAQLAASRTEAVAKVLRSLRDTELEGLARFFEASKTVDLSEFRQFTGYLTESRAIQAWTWVPVVSEAARVRDQQQAQATGERLLEIWERGRDGRRIPASGRDWYYPIFYVNPMAGNEGAVGYDLGSEPLRRAAIEQAIRTRLPTAMDTTLPVPSAGMRRYLLVLRPVFHASASDSVLGLAAALVRTEVLLGIATADRSAPLELAMLNPDGTAESLGATWNTGRPSTAGLSVTRPLLAFGKAFAITAHAGPEFIALHPIQSGATAAVTGLLLTAALVTVVTVIQRRREELERLVRERTAALRKSEEHSRLLVEYAISSIAAHRIVLDEEGRAVDYVFLSANPAFEEQTGLRVADILGRRVTEVIPGIEKTSLIQDYGSVVLTGVPISIERYIEPLGRHYHIHAYRLDEHCFATLFADVTKRKQAETELRQTVTALESTNRELEESKQIAESATRAKTEFLANMSHELRTPMTAILGFADMLLEGGFGHASQAQLEAIQTIQRNGRYLLELINDILDLSKIEAGRLRVERIPCSPSQVLAEVVSLMRVPADAKNLPLTLEYVGHIPEVIESDPLRIRQVLINLVGNAIKFTENGSVRVVAQAVQSDGAPPRLRIDVVDTGIGLTPDQLSKLFKPFSQADSSTTRRFGGTGLGLTISMRLVETLGGSIAVTSVPDKGSTFSVILEVGSLEGGRWVKPGGTIQPAAKSPSMTSAPAIQLNGRVLLAEDGPDNQRLIRMVLQKAGAEVTLVENGKAAYEEALAARTRDEPFDLILMDMQMPVMDGYEATRRLRSAGYTSPIVALTAHTMEDDAAKCLTAGCDDYLAKPIDRVPFLATIERHMSSSLLVL